METLDNNMESGEGLVINGDIRAYLMETAKWGRFLAIVGFVGMVLMIIFMIFGLQFFNSLVPQPEGQAAMQGAMSGMYIGIGILSLIYVIPLLFLYRGSVGFIRALNNNTQDDLTTGFQNYKSLFKFMGIFTIIILAIYGIVIIGTLLMGGLMS
ncbi:MAG: hypothetical protein IPL12_15980 [Bacteroidetes bacterium]|nr:hypothetical protein [Bacteroidota bacterium]MBK8344654.1 hypothetical protein [Bacteroidota bacterium]